MSDDIPPDRHAVELVNTVMAPTSGPPPVTSIGTLHELFHKFVRSIQRRAAYGECQVDWVFDTAVTAWHLADWEASETGVHLTTKKERDAHLEAIRAEIVAKCPEFAVCEQIANGAKHLKLNNRRIEDFSIGSDVVQSPSSMSALAVGPFVFSTQDAQAPRVQLQVAADVIVTDVSGRNWTASQVFMRVWIFWRRRLGLEPT